MSDYFQICLVKTGIDNLEKLSEQSARLTVVESALSETAANEIVALKDSQQKVENRIHDLQTRQNHTPVQQLDLFID